MKNFSQKVYSLRRARSRWLSIMRSSPLPEEFLYPLPPIYEPRKYSALRNKTSLYIFGNYSPNSEFCTKWPWKQLREALYTNSLASGSPLQSTFPEISSSKSALSGQDICCSHPRQRHRDSKDDLHLFVLTDRSYKVYANIGLNCPCMHLLKTILDTGAESNFFRRSELSTGFQNSTVHWTTT